MTASGDEELEGLRRENESLKEELKALSKRSKLPADKISFNPLKALGIFLSCRNFNVPCMGGLLNPSCLCPGCGPYRRICL